MRADSRGFFPPVDYSPGWIALAILVLVLLVAFYVAVPLMTRPRSPEPAPTDLDWMPDAGPTLRDKYIDLVDDVSASHHRGELGVRESHQRLSQLLRFFAYEVSGVRAPQMTLADLRTNRLTPLGDAVERLYPGAFREIERGSVDEAAAMAKRVIDTWN